MSVFIRPVFSQRLSVPADQKFYKLRARDAVTLLSEGKIDEAIQYLETVEQAYGNPYGGYSSDPEENPQFNAFASVSIDMETYYKEHPKDLEALFVLALAHAEKGNVDLALKFVIRALDGGLPQQRFLAGPRNLAANLVGDNNFQKLLNTEDTDLLHGPMVSKVTSSSAEFWVRTDRNIPVQVILSDAEGNFPPLSSQTIVSSQKRDYTAVIEMSGLQPDTTYNYQLVLNGETGAENWSFRTFPEEGLPTRFQVGFGGCSGYTPWNEHIWSSIKANKPSAFLMLGDNVYIDHPGYPDVQRYCYYRRQSRREYRDLVANIPLYAIWDDHDFGDNDSWGDPERFTPEWKVEALTIFKQNWNNPYYGGGQGQPGCWFDFSIADVDFFMLDCRYYRTGPYWPDEPNMLGAEQKEWLFKKLGNSRATFKIIASSVPWAYGSKPGGASMDTWEGFRQERAEIFSFLAEEKINGVILLSSDRHRSDVWRIEREEGYPLYEFVSGRMTNVHTHKKMPGSLYSYNEKNAYGMLVFDTVASDPSISFQILTIDDETVYEHPLKLSELSH